MADESVEPPDSLGAAAPAETDRDMTAWRGEVEFFEGVRRRLFEDPALRSKFVAVRAAEIVDKDADQFVLAKRVAERYPHEVVLVAKVELEPRVVRLPSRRIVR